MDNVAIAYLQKDLYFPTKKVGYMQVAYTSMR